MLRGKRYAYGSWVAVVWCLGVVFTALLFACQTAPITGRKQLILLSPAEENRMGITAYDQILGEEKLSEDRSCGRFADS